MPSKPYKTAEYEALSRVVTADKRFRRFQYALTFAFFLLVVAGGYNIQQNIAGKIDGLVDGSVARGEARQLETKTISRETTRYTTCLFILPVEQRTPENQQRCFQAADLPGGLTRDDFSPIIFNPDGSVVLAGEAQNQALASSSPSGASPGASQLSSNTSSPQSAPTTETPQANNVQPAEPTPTNSTPNIIERILNPVTSVLNEIL